jgi:hypothetical protein
MKKLNNFFVCFFGHFLLMLCPSLYALAPDKAWVASEQNDINYQQEPVSYEKEFDAFDEMVWVWNPDNYNFYILTPDFNWIQAEDWAKKYGGHLVTIRSRKEEEWIQQTFGYDQLWIGFNVIGKEHNVHNFYWISGEPVTYTNWAHNEPNNVGGNEDVTAMNDRDELAWNDLPKTHSKKGVAEIINFNDLIGAAAIVVSGSVVINGGLADVGDYFSSGSVVEVGSNSMMKALLPGQGERKLIVGPGSSINVGLHQKSDIGIVIETIEDFGAEIYAKIRNKSPEALEIRLPQAVTSMRGTDVLVEGDANYAKITVLEGSVEVSTPDGSQSFMVGLDYQIIATAEGLGEPYQIDPNEVLDWWNFREVTFNIDMTNAVGFDPNQHYVCLTGDFTNWAEPGTEGCLEMSLVNPDKPGTLIYTCTTEILPQEYDYKYFSDAIGQGWDGAEWEGEPMRTLTVKDHMVVNDTWGKDYYTLTLLAEPPAGGTVEGGGSYLNGNLVDLAAFPSIGYEFINWTDNQDTEVSDQALFAYTMPAENITLIANFFEKDDEDPEQNIITFNVKDLDNQPVSDAKITITPGGSEHNISKFDKTAVILPGNWAKANAVGTYFWGSGDNPQGWVFGNNTYGDKGAGMYFNVQETHTIAGAYYWISNAASGSGDVHFHIHEFNGEPGNALASVSVALNDLEPFPTEEGVSPDDYLAAFYVEFDNHIEVAGHFFVSAIFGDLDWNVHGDGIGMASTLIGQGGGGLDWAWINGSDGVWVKASEYHELVDLDIGVFPVIQNIILYTNTVGQASFQAANGDYLYIVEKPGYNSYSGVFTVSGDDVNIDIALAGLDEVPENRLISDETIADGDIDCLDATQTITVSDFKVEAGGSATLIAGQSIILLPGTMVQAGGYLHAYITTEGIFCGDLEKHFLEPELLPELIADKPKVEKSGAELTTHLPQEVSFRVYPNPTPGVFTLELTGYDQEATIVVDVFGLRGETIRRKELSGAQQLHTLSIEGYQPGMYFIRVVSGQQVGVERIIKR